MSEIKKILLIITGGIAAYKSLELIRGLKENGCDVTCVLTKSGSEFVTPLSVESLSGNKVYSDLFNLTDEHQMGHIQLSRMADVILVAPATANILSKMAYGVSDDLASTVLMATNKPILVAPAMNVQMWLNSATQRNIKTLKNDNITFIGPEVGSMACGEYGEGRLSDPKNIIESTINFIESYDFKPLKNYSALVTSGPTHEMIDPVRFISNKSSGKQGFAIAENLSRLGAKTTIISGPTDQEFPSNCIIDRVTTASEMLDACVSLLPTDIAVCAAAVGDFKVANKNIQKIKKTGNQINLALEENPDILKSISTRNSQRPKLVIGFAAETNDLIDNAKSKLNSKGCDWILANDISNGKVIGKDNNKVSLVSNLGVESWPDMSKHNVAKKLSEKIVNHFSSN
jgi:phosphopantothenoylcysteine decarboxylase / phosphopantothenate---cysteine ligase